MPAPTGQDLGDDIRDDLNAAFEAAENPEGGETPPETPPAGETPPETLPEGGEGGETPPETPPEGAEPPASEAKPEGEAKPPIAPAPEPATKDDKAPGTWNPQAREAWANLPKEVKAEVWKREKDASRALTMSTEARRFQSEFSNMIQPYLGFIAAEGGSPLQAVNFMMRTGALLRVGTDQQKAELVRDVIRDYKVNLELLDSLMAGESPQANPQSMVRDLLRQELAPIFQQMQLHQRGQQQQAQADEAEIVQELETFAEKNEFYWDVKEDMEVILEVALRRGRPMTLTQAYERATMESEPVRKVIEARKTRNTALEANKRAAAARRNASSITPSANASTVTPAKGNTLRDDIVAAMDAQQGR